MKSIVIYFSQTGNTEKIARWIQTGIQQTTGQCDLNEIRQVNPLGLKDYDLIGIGSPVIGQCPEDVLEFVRHMRFVGGKHALASAPTAPATSVSTRVSTRCLPGKASPSSTRLIGAATVTSCICPHPTRRRVTRTLLSSSRPRPSAGTCRSAACESAPANPNSSPLCRQSLRLLARRRGRAKLLHAVHGQLPDLRDRPLSRSAPSGRALPRLRILLPALSDWCPRHDCAGARAGSQDNPHELALAIISR
jgi:hypothetical protein